MTAPQLIAGGGPNDPGFNQPLLGPLLDAINVTGKSSRIGIAVSFIRQSGLALLQDALFEALDRGVQLDVITSDYLDVTEPVALRRLMLLAERGARVGIYESADNPGFHLKSYLFIQQHTRKRLTGLGFVGSSNISRAALTDSLEWNWCLRVDDDGTSPAAASLLALQEQMQQLAQDARVVPLSHDWIDDYLIRYQHSPLTGLRVITGDSTTDAETLRETPLPNAVQEEALAALKASRSQGYKRGLVVMATGLGKTWLAAFDARQLKAKKLLFVAHRDEIIRQAQATFIRMQPTAHTGLYNGQQQDQADWLFASVQTLGRAVHLRRFAPDHFDYIIVDEFHHSTSPTYRRLLDHFRPRFLLGLTATPDRTDQADILALCDDNLVFERGLRDAIVDSHLVPFIYQGVYDEFINYDEIPWRNGRFDPEALDAAFASKKRAGHALEQWRTFAQNRTLAFCISIRHADFMARIFTDAGIRAAAVYAGSAMPRNQALSELAGGKLQVIFSVDLFNEGTDLPAIDTLLMLRPTESRIVFLQQLGRGLRLHPGKQQLMVVDLVGNHKACLFKPELLQEITRIDGGSGQTTPALPEGCFINLEPELIPLMDKLRYGGKVRVVDDYRRLKEQLGHRPSAIQAFQAGLDFAKLRKQHGSWFELTNSEGDLSAEGGKILAKLRDFLLTGIEATTLTKSFKIVLLQALLELDGLRQPPTLVALAEQSRYVLERHPDLLQLDLPARQQAMSADSTDWLGYWKGNPIKFSTGGNQGSQADYWFEIKDDRFCPRFELPIAELDTLHQMMQELVDLRLAEYRRRKAEALARIKAPATVAQADVIELPYFPSLKIACGHFKTGSGENAELMAIADHYGPFDIKRHFLARASGHSMNGGKQPVQDGDLLLLEWITPQTAGSISNQTLAIERQDESGDNQYLLRVVKKNPDGSYRLHATNPDYEDLAVTDEMKPFARFRGVIAE
ncbi:DEAD/DEAH box helicase family protein [Oceanisphaera arctica]|uniref:DEAD/DEAH box helicase n=1 Tax=Oceanisphaera arctica TaxID=641510 RepID=A0A2P5TJQ1_9GAMM|nr:DEAD/DEAH box helicase family protein [Oceanisphaera arctica]PPL15237.1 DEAD/DEAH box helicase [Oceanisphaera arctica]GHA28079.1 helicase [Oceanisphaera arctica]